MGGLGKYVDWLEVARQKVSEVNGEEEFRKRVRQRFESLRERTFPNTHPHSTDFSHISRRKTRGELCRISAAVMGIEFAYAAETAFVSPLLLGLGIRHRHMSLVWTLSPCLGFFLTPLLGSLSDGCTLTLGRRRPFILLLSVGVLLGLLLVPNGELIGDWLGDEPISIPETHNLTYFSTSSPVQDENSTDSVTGTGTGTGTTHHPWGLFFTILGTVFLDFDADACQSPSRAYMLDVTIPDDHARGLSTFTIMAGLGGFFGYMLGALSWEHTFIGEVFGGHVRAVFTLVLFLFIFCVFTTVRSFQEIPIGPPRQSKHKQSTEGYDRLECDPEEEKFYGTIHETSFSIDDNCLSRGRNNENPGVGGVSEPTFKEYLKTIIRLPTSLQWLCFTNFFSWMSLVCYSLYFTDFVGEGVFGGDPVAPRGSVTRDLYEEGVRFGCWGMSLYSLSCSIYSLGIDKLISRFGSKRIYFWGQIVYASGMVLMGISRSRLAVILFSSTAGIMYATLFTMPYLLVARYHAAQTFDMEEAESEENRVEVRGLGTDVAIVSSMVFLAQITQSLVLGNVVTLVGSTTAIVFAAALFATCAAISSTRVLYLDF